MCVVVCLLSFSGLAVWFQAVDYLSMKLAFMVLLWVVPFRCNASSLSAGQLSGKLQANGSHLVPAGGGGSIDGTFYLYSEFQLTYSFRNTPVRSIHSTLIVFLS